VSVELSKTNSAKTTTSPPPTGDVTANMSRRSSSRLSMSDTIPSLSAARATRPPMLPVSAVCSGRPSPATDWTTKRSPDRAAVPTLPPSSTNRRATAWKRSGLPRSGCASAPTSGRLDVTPPNDDEITAPAASACSSRRRRSLSRTTPFIRRAVSTEPAAMRAKTRTGSDRDRLIKVASCWRAVRAASRRLSACARSPLGRAALGAW
jgi:hypothetical protein